jgi:predicted ATPase
VTTPFVGRETKLAMLTADFDAAIAGHGEVVLVAGEPGVRHRPLTIRSITPLPERL